MPEELRAVIERHRKRLMSIQGVVGLAATSDPDDPDRRLIMIETDVDDWLTNWPSEIPRELDGYPVRLKKHPGYRAL